MSNLLPLHPGAALCVQCGACCKHGPCAFGEPTGDAFSPCRFLLPLISSGHARYECGIFQQITARPVREWWSNPAFGAGCCMTLFNSDRIAILKERGQADRDGQRQYGVTREGAACSDVW